MSDTSKIFAVEDWKKIYQAFSQIDLSSYDFDNLRRVLLDYVKNNFSEEFNDFIESSEFIALIDMMAYMGQSLAYRVDLNSRENFIDTATRQDSVIRLARLVGYNSKRNIAASGMLKLTTIQTSQNINDSNGNSLRNVPISWNDSTNPNFQEHFNIILGQAMSSTQVVGKPARRAVINGVTTELYELNSLNTSPVLPFSQTVGGVAMNFEMIGAYLDSDGTLTERVPVPNSAFSLLYRNDGRGNGSPNTGWFIMFTQGTLSSTDFGVAGALPNQVLSINANGINNTDTWLFELNADGNFTALWKNIPEVSGNNIIYNSIAQNIRKVYSTVSRANDAVDLVFADGTFGDIPNGNFRYYYRTSNGLSYQIRPADMTKVNAALTTRTKSGELATLTMNTSLRTTVSNSTSAESFNDIKTRAPQNYYTQNRMITAEDYNIYPVITNQNVLKAKSVNRTSSGTNRYLDIVDPTGKYSSLMMFADDGVLYRKDFNDINSFPWSSTVSDITAIIQDRIRPYLTNEEMINFYYVYFPRVDFSSTELAWNLLHDDINSHDGYFIDSFGTPQAFGPNAGSYPFNVVAKDTLTKFTAPAGKYFDANNDLQTGTPGAGDATYLWTKVWNIIGDGRNNGAGALGNGYGPVVLADKIPTEAIIYQAMPSIARDLGNVEATVYTALLNQENFGLGYSQKTASWYFIDGRDLGSNQAFSLTNAQDVSRKNLDSSWLMKFEFRNNTYKSTVRLLQTIFRSEAQTKFYFDTAHKVVEPLTGEEADDCVFVLKTNSDWNNSNKPYLNDSQFHIIGNIQDLDGFVSPNEIRVGFADPDNDSVPDDLDVFTNVVNVSTFSAAAQKDFQTNEFVTIFERYTDSTGFYRWRTYSSANVIVADTPANFGIYYPGTSTPYADGQLFYARSTTKMYTWVSADGTYYATASYKAYFGRQNLQFKYVHNAADTRRIDPSLGNLIDIYVLTKSYNDNLRNWLKYDRNDLNKPSPPTSQELRNLLLSIESVKGMSDDIIYNPVVFKILFGSKAAPALQANFKVVKNASTLVSDNEVRSRIVSAIDLFFANANYDFGDTFYFTELAAFVHLQLSGLISSIVLVPDSTDTQFGDLFQITSNPDEILLHDVTVDNIIIVSSVTPASIAN